MDGGDGGIVVCFRAEQFLNCLVASTLIAGSDENGVRMLGLRENFRDSKTKPLIST